MNNFPILLAESAPRFHYLNGRFHEGGPGFGLTEFLWTAGVVLGVVVVVWLLMLYMQRRERHSYHSPVRLFRELCAAHRLTWADGWLLRRLGSALHLASPAALFLRPELFAAPHVPAALAEHAQDLAQLRARIFATQS
jgi:hypothetical protein